MPPTDALQRNAQQSGTHGDDPYDSDTDEEDPYSSDTNDDHVHCTEMHSEEILDAHAGGPMYGAVAMGKNWQSDAAPSITHTHMHLASGATVFLEIVRLEKLSYDARSAREGAQRIARSARDEFEATTGVDSDERHENITATSFHVRRAKTERDKQEKFYKLCTVEGNLSDDPAYRLANLNVANVEKRHRILSQAAYRLAEAQHEADRLVEQAYTLERNAEALASSLLADLALMSGVVEDIILKTIGKESDDEGRERSAPLPPRKLANITNWLSTVGDPVDP